MDKTLSKLVQEYIEALKSQGKSIRTVYTYGKDLEQIQAFFGNDKEIGKITLPQVGKFYKSDELLRLPNGKPRAPRTILKTVRVFRLLLTWAQTQGDIETLPLPKNLPDLGQLSTQSDTLVDPKPNESVDDTTNVIHEALP